MCLGCTICRVIAEMALEGKCAVNVLVTQSSPTLCDPMDCNLPGSSVHGTLQARTLEWGTSPFSRESFLTQGLNRKSCIAGRFCTVLATWETGGRWPSLKWSNRVTKQLKKQSNNKNKIPKVGIKIQSFYNIFPEMHIFQQQKQY